MLLLMFVQILQPANMVEFTHMASHLLPGHALFSSSLHPFYFSPNAVHFAALDSLADFTNKVRAPTFIVFTSLFPCFPLIWPLNSSQ